MYIIHCILVKAPLRVLYDKIQYKEEVEWQIQDKAKASAVFAMDPTMSAIFYRAALVYSTFTDFLVLCGWMKRSIISAFNKNSRHDDLGGYNC